jgi:hypothetical protein
VLPEDCRLSSFDPLQIAWAAGFFDGEGSTIAYFPNKKSRYLRVQATVPQSGHGEVPEVLHRFRGAMLGMGKIVGPNEDGIYVWRTRGFEETQAAIALLWRHLGPVKRAQAAAAIGEVLDGYRSGRLKARGSRRPRNDHIAHSATGSATAPAHDLERAWAAGFMDAEGCFGTYHSQARKRGPDWRRIRVSAAQHAQVGAPAEVLVRLQAAFSRLGRIKRHGDPDDYKWLAEGAGAVEHVLQRTAPWLGPVKLAQAALARETFGGQLRLRGNETHCVRGHAYTGSSMRGGRMRRICRPCDRITSRLRRAATGILPRQFKDVTRRYTF